MLQKSRSLGSDRLCRRSMEIAAGSLRSAADIRDTNPTISLTMNRSMNKQVAQHDGLVMELVVSGVDQGKPAPFCEGAKLIERFRMMR